MSLDMYLVRPLAALCEVVTVAGWYLRADVPQDRPEPPDWSVVLAHAPA